MVIGAVIVAPLAQVVVSAVAALVSLSKNRVHVANVASYTVMHLLPSPRVHLQNVCRCIVIIDAGFCLPATFVVVVG